MGIRENYKSPPGGLLPSVPCSMSVVWHGPCITGVVSVRLCRERAMIWGTPGLWHQPLQLPESDQLAHLCPGQGTGLHSGREFLGSGWVWLSSCGSLGFMQDSELCVCYGVVSIFERW